MAHAPSAAVAALQRARLRELLAAEGAGASGTAPRGAREALALLRRGDAGAVPALQRLVEQLGGGAASRGGGAGAAGARAAFGLAALHRSGIARDLGAIRGDARADELLHLAADGGDFWAAMALAEREAVDGRCDAAVTRAMGAAARLPPSDAGYSLEPPRLRDRERHGGQYVTSAHVPDPVMEEVFLEDGNLVTGGWAGEAPGAAWGGGNPGGAADGLLDVKLGSADAEALMRHLSELAEGGDPEGLYGVGYLRLMGLEGGQAGAAGGAHKLLRAAAETHQHAGAHTLLGLAYALGRGGLPRDYRKAFEHYELAALGGDLDGKFGEAWMTLHGLGVASEPAKAFEAFTVIHEEGHWLGPYQLAQMHAEGQGTPRNCAEAWRLIKDFVQQEGPWAPAHSEAIELLDAGNGWGALSIFNELAEVGAAGGAANAGWVLRKGLALPGEQGMAAAEEFFLRSAKSGEPAGWVDAGDLWYSAEPFGLGAEPEMQKAFRYYSRAAEAGLAEGAFCLAHMHFWGHGTPRDFQAAGVLLEQSVGYAQDNEKIVVQLALWALTWHGFMRGLQGWLSGTPSGVAFVLGSLACAAVCHFALLRRPQARPWAPRPAVAR